MYVGIVSIGIGMCGAAHLNNDAVAHGKRYIASVYSTTGICGNIAMVTDSERPLSLSFDSWEMSEDTIHARVYDIE